MQAGVITKNRYRVASLLNTDLNSIQHLLEIIGGAILNYSDYVGFANYVRPRYQKLITMDY